MRTKARVSHAISMIFLGVLFSSGWGRSEAGNSALYWNADDRAQKTAGLIPGRSVPFQSSAEFFLEWTRKHTERWRQTHPGWTPQQTYETNAAAAPADNELFMSVPDHITPFAIPAAGQPDSKHAIHAMIEYCPFCGATGLVNIDIDPSNHRHAIMSCCHQDLYERAEDCPRGYKYPPDSFVEFRHMDDSVKSVPACTVTDKEGMKWKVFVGTIFSHKRWLGANGQGTEFFYKYLQTADPLYAHKMAVLLDRVAEVYYGLPLAWYNDLARGADGKKQLSRSEFESLPRPVRFGAPWNGPWNRNLPLCGKGWYHHGGPEITWIDRFVMTRHHPAFRYYSQRKYGDPDALDRKIISKLVRDYALLFKSFNLTSDYQDGSYADLVMVAILLQDSYLFDFAAGNQECVLYNHHYHDAMNGEGSPGYMTLLNIHFYPYMNSSQPPWGWLLLAPDFLKQHPFFKPCAEEYKKLFTTRQLALEFGDQYMSCFNNQLLTDPVQVALNERRPSMNWPGFGVGVLRVGAHGHRQEICLTYDRVSLHSAADRLGIECWVDGIPVMRHGGYANPGSAAHFDESNHEIMSFLNSAYPHKVFGVVSKQGGFDAWIWVHSAMARNTVTVNELETGPGWQDNQGFGAMITYKGGEAYGTAGAGFQVLDCRDHDSFARLGVPVQTFRRCLMAVEGPDGRPYVVDILRLEGGKRHALYQSAWAERAAENLPPVADKASDLVQYLDKIRSDEKCGYPPRETFAEIKKVRIHKPASEQWGLVWKTDYAAYAPCGADGKRQSRPLPADIGQVRLRLIGIGGQGAQTNATTTLISAKGPWVAAMAQPLPAGKYIRGEVGFRDATDMLIESRRLISSNADDKLKSVFVHLLEGYREGEDSVIRKATQLPLAKNSKAVEGSMALQMEMAGGHTDTVIFQPEPGEVRLSDGLITDLFRNVRKLFKVFGKARLSDSLITDARYALVRRAKNGAVLAAEMARGSSLRCEGFSVALPGDLTGKVVDLIGDITGTRQESAFIIQTDKKWPEGDILAGRPISIETINHHKEAYTIQKITRRPDGLTRVDLANYAPLSWGWYQVSACETGRVNVLRSNRQLWHGIDTTWWRGAKIWFPLKGRTYTILSTGSDRVTLTVEEKVNLTAQGIAPGDWFMIYALEPGAEVNVAAEFSYNRKTMSVGGKNTDKQHPPTLLMLRASGAAELEIPKETGAMWARKSQGVWTPFQADKKSGNMMTIKIDPELIRGSELTVLMNKPAWLKPEDHAPPRFISVRADRQSFEPKEAMNLGKLPATPEVLAVDVRDDDNPIDESSISIAIDGLPVSAASGLVTFVSATNDPRSACVKFALKRALPNENDDEPSRHTISFNVADCSLDRRASVITITYEKQASGNAIYMSDIQEEFSYAHGAVKKDCDYYGKALRMRSKVWTKGLMAHVEGLTFPSRSEIIYDLTPLPERRKFKAVIGIGDCSGGGGSVTFEVRVYKNGAWEMAYKSPVILGTQNPIPIEVDITGAKKIRLYCTDAGDGIGCDHAVWCNARLE